MLSDVMTYFIFKYLTLKILYDSKSVAQQVIIDNCMKYVCFGHN